jgi:YD repeat-containing protein
MIKSILAVLFALLCLQCVLSGGAAAQTGSGCWSVVSCGEYSLGSLSCVPQLPQGATNCIGVPFEWTTICQIPNSSCPPPDAAPETCPTCAAAAGSPAAGHPISLASGNTYIKETDIRIPGLSGGLSLVRTWNSLWPATQSSYQIGLFGPNWRSTYEERVFLGADNYMKYGRSDGSFWSFGYNGGNYNVAAPANMSATLIAGSSYWAISFQNGEQRLFDNSTGHLISIIDRNGNTTSLSYDTSGRLVTVTDPVSRHLYFSYGSGGASYLVSGVSSDVGVSTSYSYDSLGRLSQVTEQDSSTISFTYNSQSLISLVTDSLGNTLESHTYDAGGRGLTSSQASGVNAVTVSY